MRNDNEHSMQDLIHDFINKSGKQKLFAEQEVVNKWPEYVGALCAKQCTQVSISNSVVKVKIPNAALRFELMGHKSTIIERINSGYTVPVVKNILFY